MRAIVIERFGGPECLVYRESPEPEPVAGHVVIEVKAPCGVRRHRRNRMS
ncbi:hypothetical protein SAMN05421833_13097 [Microbispora rosea]|uniref:NADPH2:quinone reductase n=1 Tax=Microbispora rosea TaxID=58117 RepID=A0A1N7GN78_9ACTN|nr:hypothetical protein SAMN05421833_13097 [Microbispora rosea]